MASPHSPSPPRFPLPSRHLLAWLVVCHLLTAALLGLRALGLFQAVELPTSDMVAHLAASKTDPAPDRVVIVGVTEADLDSYGWPLPDGVLAELIERILAQGARVVGVDLYRNHPVPPGSEALDGLLRSRPEIFWITRFIASPTEEGVPPPPALPPDQAGFNDLTPDPDGVVRRGLLFLDDGRTVAQAFSLRVALAWLKPLGIAPRPDREDRTQLALGAAIIPPLQPHDGPYAGIDAGGYQFLLHSRARRHLLMFTPAEVLEGRIPAGALQDRLVLVGSHSASTGDIFTTPFHPDAAGPDRLTRGVELHGRIASQLIAQALGEIPPVRPLGALGTGLWIWFWTLLGGAAGLRLHGQGRFLLAGAGGAALLLAAAWAALRHAGLWLPVVPPGIGLLAALALLHAHRGSWLKRQNEEAARRNAELERTNLRMEAELDVVRRLQTLLLPRPNELAAIPGLEIAAHMAPAASVGGDYYDLIPHAEGAWLAIGDATGHGLEAGALALMAQMGTRVLLADSQTDPKRFLGAMNLALCQNVRRLGVDGNLTYCLLDIREDRLFAAGQHESLLLVRRDGVEEISTQGLGFFIGFMEEIGDLVHCREIPFTSGELLVLYSDGLTEAADADGNEFGTARLTAVLEGRFGQEPAQAKTAILAALAGFVGEQGRIDDDVTLVVVRRA